LNSAANNRYIEVVNLLLGKVDTDQKDIKYSRTALSYTVQGSYKAVVKLLLADCTVDPDSRDTIGRTLLLFTAIYRYNTIVITLLTYKYIDPDRKDYYSSIPLSIAV
jgi:ankyrin repeat protein